MVTNLVTWSFASCCSFVRCEGCLWWLGRSLPDWLLHGLLCRHELSSSPLGQLGHAWCAHCRQLRPRPALYWPGVCLKGSQVLNVSKHHPQHFPTFLSLKVCGPHTLAVQGCFVSEEKSPMRGNYENSHPSVHLWIQPTAGQKLFLSNFICSEHYRHFGPCQYGISMAYAEFPWC